MTVWGDPSTSAETELLLREELNSYRVVPLRSLVRVFSDELRYGDSGLEIRPGKTPPPILFMCQNELIRIASAPSAKDSVVEEHIEWIISLLREQKVPLYRELHYKKERELGSLKDRLVFSRAPYKVFLHKKGKVFGTKLLRPAFTTTEAFGQTEADQNTLIKPNYYKNNEVMLQRAGAVDEKQFLPWAELKEPMAFRLLFLERGEKDRRQRAIYYKLEADAQRLKSNAIVQKFNKQNAVNPIKVFKSIWKIRQAEHFYRNHLSKFFLDSVKAEESEKLAKTLEEELRKYMDRKFPQRLSMNKQVSKQVANDSTAQQLNPQPSSTSFADGSYLKLKLAPEVEREKAEFATLINPPPMLEEKGRKKPGLSTGYFDDRVRFADPNQRLETPLPSTTHLFAANDARGLLDSVLSRCKLFVELRGAVLAASAEDWLEAAMFLGGRKTQAPLFAAGSVGSAMSYAASAWTQATPAELANFSLAVKGEKGEAKVPVGDLREKLEFVGPAMPFVVRMEFKGAPALVAGTVVLVPTDLETAHLVFDSELLKTHRRDLGDILASVDSPAALRAALFSPPAAVSGEGATGFAALARGLDAGPGPLARLLDALEEAGLPKLLEACPRAANWPRVLEEIGLAVEQGEAGGQPALRTFVVKAAGAISPRERWWLARSLWEVRDRNILSPPTFETLRWSGGVLKSVHAAVDAALVARPAAPGHAARLRAIAVRAAVVLESNKAGGKSAPVHFPPMLVAGLAHLIDLSAHELDDSQLLDIALAGVAGTFAPAGYSLVGAQTQLDRAWVFFSSLLQAEFGDAFAGLARFGRDWGNLVAEAVLGGLASLVEPPMFVAFSDFKQAIALLLRTRNAALLEKLAGIGLEIGPVLDIFLLAKAVDRRAPRTAAVPREDFWGFLSRSVRAELALGPTALVGLLPLFAVCERNGWFAPVLSQFRRLVEPRRTRKRAAFTSLQVALRTARVTPAEAVGALAPELDSEVFAAAAASLHPLRAAWSKRPGAEIDADVFFEIAPSFDFDGPGGRAPHDAAEALTLGLAGLHPPESPAPPRSTLANVADFAAEQLRPLLASLESKMGPAGVDEVVESLVEMWEGKRIPLVGVAAALVSAAAENLAEAESALIELALKLSKMAYPAAAGPGGKGDSVLNFVAHSLRQQIDSFAPGNAPASALANEIDSLRPPLFAAFLRSARLTLNEDVIDITELCVRQLDSQFAAAGTPALVFDAGFSRALAAVWAALEESDPKFRAVGGAELFLEAMEFNRPRFYVVPFRIVRHPELQIFAKTLELAFPNDAANETHLLPPSALSESLRRSPLAYFSLPDPSPQVLNIAPLLKLAFMFRGTQVFEAEVTFASDGNCSRAGCVPAAWPYDDAAPTALAKPSAPLRLHSADRLLRVSDLISLITSLTISALEGPDVFRFLRVLRDNAVVHTPAGKIVPPESLLAALAEYDKAVAAKTPLVLHYVAK